MPEGPECRTTAVKLDSMLSDVKIWSLEVLGGRFIAKPPSGLSEIVGSLPIKCSSVRSKGKFIWFELENDWSIWSTLGMSGHWSVKTAPHAAFVIRSEAGEHFFIDQRHFGTLHFVQGRDKLLKKLSTLGPDPLQEDLAFADFKTRLLKHSSKTLVEPLMNQKVVAGVGNYVKAEVLYRARLSPHRLVRDLNDFEIETLRSSIVDVLRESFLAKGASIRNYRVPDGTSGDFVFEFRVYKRKHDPSGNPVIGEDTMDGRTTWWVPSIQR